MGVMDNIERGLERAVNGVFAKTFKSSVQPVEIVAALKRELDTKAVAIDRDRVLAPNIFAVRVSPADAEQLQAHGSTLTTELCRAVSEYAHAQGYQLLGPASISIEAVPAATAGTVEIVSNKPNSGVTWQPVLELEGRQHPLTKPRTIVGRGSEADIKISDTAASRKHLEIIWDGKHGLVRDLGSTNGSKIDGQRFSEARLQQDTVIYIGKTALSFRFAPTNTGQQASGGRV